VHRGPDLKPRLFFPSVLLLAFTEEGELARGKRRSGAQQRKRARALHAATLNTVVAIQGIALAAAEGDVDARNQLIRIVHDGNAMLQPTPAAEAKVGGQGPILPEFERYKPSPEDQPGPPSSIAPAFEQRSTVIGPDGTE